MKKNYKRNLRPSRSLTAACALEPLETRTLFSNINWVNEGNDSFIFFGANQNVARDIVNKAISDWERVIVDFNYDDNGSSLSNTFNLTLNAASMDFGVRGSAQNTGRDDSTDRKPTSATVTIDNDGGGLGWYFDPNVFDDGEYTNPVNLWTANVPFPGGPTGSDFYRTVVHEIGHALGITLSSNLKVAQMAVDSGIDDPFAAGTRLFTLNTFGTPAPEYTLTAGHLWEGDGTGGITNLSEHPNDLMNEGRTVPGGTNRRQLISDTDALLLKDVYNYQIVLPGQINTFAANLNEATGVLTVNGNLVFSSLLEPFNLPNDFIDLEWGGINITVELAGGSVASEKVFEFQVNSIVVNTGAGNDSVEINALPSGKSVTVNLGDGFDDVVFGGEGRFMSSIGSNVTINGGADTNGVAFRDDNTGVSGAVWTINSGSIARHVRNFTFNDVQNRTIHAAGNFNNTFLVNAIDEGTTVNLIGNGGSEAFEVGNHNLTANIRGTLNITGGGGSDFLRLNDGADAPGDDVWTFNTGVVHKSGAPAINYNSLEGITVTAGSQDDQFNIARAEAPISINGGFGNDEFYVGTGDIDLITRVTVMGSVGDDLLVVDDSADNGNDNYTLTAGAITKPGNPEAFQAIEINTQIGLETERTILIANDGSNTINVNGGRGLEIKARAGGDQINVNEHFAGSPVIVDSGAGTDGLSVNTDGAGSATVEFRESQDLVTLFIGSGGRLNVAPGTNSTVDVLLGYSNAGLLDLNDNTMIARVGAGGGSVDFFRQQIAAGHDSGTWNGGSGITSSHSNISLAADGIGYASATQLGRTSFNGIPISGNDLVLDHTLYGDANLDHQVTLQDFNRLAGSFGQSNRFWSQGDFDYNGTVALPDFNRLAANFGQTAAPDGRMSPSGPNEQRLIEELS